MPVPIEDLLHQGISSRHGVADHVDVGGERDLVGAPAVDQFDARGLELIAHRRIDVCIAAGDAMAGGARNEGEPAHEGAADAEDVQVHSSYELRAMGCECELWARARGAWLAARSRQLLSIVCDSNL